MVSDLKWALWNTRAVISMGPLSTQISSQYEHAPQAANCTLFVIFCNMLVYGWRVIGPTHSDQTGSERLRCENNHRQLILTTPQMPFTCVHNENQSGDRMEPTGNFRFRVRATLYESFQPGVRR